MTHNDGSIGRAFLGMMAVLLCGLADAQAAQTTKVYAVAASYTDARISDGAPARLHKILKTVRAFYAQGSAGRHDFVGQTHPTPLELPQPRPEGRCQLPSPTALSSALREAGISLAGYHALALVIPSSTLGCPGGVQTAFHHRDSDGSTRRVPLAVSWSLTDRFIAHEIVHTHGVGHAKALLCPRASLAANCTTKEYGNVWDLMGNGSFQMLSAPLRTWMGWTEPLVHASGRASYTIGAATMPGGLPTAVRVPLAVTGNNALEVLQPLTLWIEYRAPFGFDKRMGGSRFVGFATGAMVNLTGSWRGTGGSSSRTTACPPTSPCLIDTTPQSGSFKDAGLTVGRSWTEPFSGTQVTVESRTETTLTFTVSAP